MKTAIERKIGKPLIAANDPQRRPQGVGSPTSSQRNFMTALLVSLGERKSFFASIALIIFGLVMIVSSRRPTRIAAPHALRTRDVSFCRRYDGSESGVRFRVERKRRPRFNE